MSAPRTRADKGGSVHGRTARRRPALRRIHRPVGEPSRASRASLRQPHAVRAKQGRSRSSYLPRCNCVRLHPHATPDHFRSAARARRAAAHDRGSQRPSQADEALPLDARSRRAATGSPPAPHGAPGVAVRRCAARRDRGVRPFPRRRQPFPADSAGRINDTCRRNDRAAPCRHVRRDSDGFADAKPRFGHPRDDFADLNDCRQHASAENSPFARRKRVLTSNSDRKSDPVLHHVKVIRSARRRRIACPQSGDATRSLRRHSRTLAQPIVVSTFQSAGAK